MWDYSVNDLNMNLSKETLNEEISFIMDLYDKDMLTIEEVVDYVFNKDEATYIYDEASPYTAIYWRLK